MWLALGFLITCQITESGTIDFMAEKDRSRLGARTRHRWIWAVLALCTFVPAWVADLRTPAPQTREIHIEAFRYGFSPARIHVNRGDRLRLSFRPVTRARVSTCRTTICTWSLPRAGMRSMFTGCRVPTSLQRARAWSSFPRGCPAGAGPSCPNRSSATTPTTGRCTEPSAATSWWLPTTCSGVLSGCCAVCRSSSCSPGASERRGGTRSTCFRSFRRSGGC